MENPTKRRRKKRGYTHHSPAVCVTIYDISGRTLPERDVNLIVDSIQSVVSTKGYVINVART